MNVLLTSAGRRTYLIDYFKEALGKGGKVYASNSIYTYSLGQADGYTLTPQIYDDGYIDYLIEYCKDNSIEVVISLFDIDLPVLAAAKERFLKAGVNVIVSAPEVISICNDKWKTYLFLKQIGLRCPKTFVDLESAQTALDTGDITYPLFIKPRWGMGSIGVYKVEDAHELGIFYHKLQKQIFETYLRFESAEDAAHCIVIQEGLRGRELGLDVLNDLKGNYVTTIAKEKIAMRAGETDIAEIVDPGSFIPVAMKLSQTLGHIANLDVDCFVAEDGEVYVLELNCRFGGQYPFSHLAGVNFPKQIIEWCEGKPTNEKLITATIGVRSCKDLHPVLI